MKYFLHDTNSFSDEKVTELFIAFGYEGVGLFYTILERIAMQEKPIKTSVLKTQLHVGRKLEKCWLFMENIGLISSSNDETFNERILSYSQKYQIQKEKTAEKVKQWRERHAVEKNVTGYVPVSNLPKVKLSKVNKDIEREMGAEAPAPTHRNFKKWNEQEFIDELSTFKDKYDRDTLNAFFKYWSEKSPSGKMLFQLKQTWETKKRLETWSRRDELKK